ncbi:hypothetical protein ACFZAM_02980 [Streptomyces sp. NPDC008079]|uniref:hypothetical protein n=1 Tax=Streptomyces sp. NPDC008079 TaxID=3364806 RepID=UPI0036E64448
MLVLASLAAVLLAAAVYAVVCAAAPFRPSGRLRLGRRALNAWRHTNDRGTR